LVLLLTTIILLTTDFCVKVVIRKLFRGFLF